MNIYLTNRQDNFAEVREAFSKHVQANSDPDVQYMMLMVNEEVVCVSGWDWDMTMPRIFRVISAAQVWADETSYLDMQYVSAWENGWTQYKGQLKDGVTVHYLIG